MKHQFPLLTLVVNQANNEAVIDIDGEIGWAEWDGEEYQYNTKAAIKRQLKAIAKMDVDKIIVNISSLGGFIDDGFAIHDMLASHKAKVETNIIGLTASAATLIAQAGDTRRMSNNAMALIHHVWGLAIGNAFDLESQAKEFRKFDQRIAEVYAKRSDSTAEKMLEVMGAAGGWGEWLDAEEYEELGLIDEAYEPMKAAAAVVDPMNFELLGIQAPEGWKGAGTTSTTNKVDVEEGTEKELGAKIERLTDATEKLLESTERRNKLAGRQKRIDNLKSLI
jgi:ATP-dependent protease ClpP protease subunit